MMFIPLFAVVLSLLTVPVSAKEGSGSKGLCLDIVCTSGVHIWASCNTGYPPNTTVKDPNGWACYWNGTQGNHYNRGEPIYGNGWIKNPSCPSNDNCSGTVSPVPTPTPSPTPSPVPSPCPTVVCTSGVQIWSSCNTGYPANTTVKDPNGWACYWNGTSGNNFNRGEPILGNGWMKNPACPPNDNCTGTPSPSPTPTPSVTPSAPPSSPFVTRNGSQLMLNGSPFVPVGTNIFWLGLDGDTWAPPSQNRVREAFAIAKAMGANTVRSHTLGIATYAGSSYAILTGERTYNDANFGPIDYAINEARYYGIHLIIPLTDQYHYFHGGKWDFLYFANAISSSDFQNIGDGTGQFAQGQLFYTNPTVVGDFEDYIAHILNHTNTINGIQLKNDPTILAWELGNELGAWNLGNSYNTVDPPPPASWAQQIAQYIKSIDPHHLVVDGPDGVQTADLPIPQIDIYSRHPYGDENLVPGEYTQVKGANKVYLIGEFDAHSNLTSFLQTLQSEGQGGLWWSLFGHNDSCTGYAIHNDGVSITYPGLNSGEPQLLLNLTNFGLQIDGQSPLSSLPVISCQQPELAP